MTILQFKNTGSLAVLVASLCLGLERSAVGQSCDLTFPPSPANDLTSYITQYPNYKPSLGPTDPLISTFLVDVTNIVNHTNYNNPPIADGLYPAWCVDEWVKINAVDITVPGGLFTGALYSTCDPNLNSELPPGHPNTLVSANVWQMVNYILNHQTYNGSNAFYWDVQDAINTLVGSAVGSTNPCGGFYSTPAPEGGCENFPVFDQVVVDALLTAATNNAPTWVPQCGDVLGAVYVTSPTNQFLLLEVPVPCTPCIGVTKQVACLQPGATCGAFGSVAQGFAGVTCSNTPDSPAFCYEITITNCGTIPLTNVTVSDSLLGNLTTNFFAGATTVFEPGAFVKAYFSMSFATNATNYVLVQGVADLAGTVTNGSEIFTNGTPVAANANATALVTPASISCNLSLSSPYVSPANNGGSTLILPEILPDGVPVTVGVTVANTGSSPLSDVTIVLSAAQGLTCGPVPPFSLPAGGSTTIILCYDSVTCPADQNFSVTVTGMVDSDAAHCGVFDMGGNPIMVCSSCLGTVECSTTGGCTVPNQLSGTVVLDCVVGSANLAGDTGLSGLPVSLYGSSGTSLLASTTTDSKGNYAFNNLGSGTYTVAVTLTTGYAETYPLGITTGQQQVTVVACENTTGINFGYAATNPPQISVPPGQYLNCNPTSLPSDANIASTVTALVSCGIPAITVTHSDTNTSCAYTRTYLITVSDTYGNLATTNVIYSWSSNSTPLVITGTPTNSYLGCNPTILPTDSSVTNGVTAGNACGNTPLSVTNVLTTNGCYVTNTFTITATDACGNTGSSSVAYSWQANSTPLAITGTPTGSYLGCNPKSLPTAASVTKGMSAANACGSVPLTVTCVLTTNGCYVTNTFKISAMDACGNTGSSSVTYSWLANSTPLMITGTPAGSFLGCNPKSLPTAASVTKGMSAANACGTAPLSVNNVLTTKGCYVTNTFTITAMDACGNSGSSSVVYSWTTNTMPPMISGVPTNTFLGCNGYTNLPGDTTVSNEVRVAAACGTAAITVTHVDATNGCSGTRVFTITAEDNCGNIATAGVTYSWTVNSVGPNVMCPPPVTIFTNFCQMYCTFSAGDWAGSCNGGARNNNNWWQNWCGQNSSSQCWPSWTNWWNSCNGNNNSQYTNFWSSCNNNHPTSWWGSWSGQTGNQWNQTGNWWGNQSYSQHGYWYDSWNNCNNGSQTWVPCGGNNPNTILSTCFSKVYPKGCVTVGLPGSGKCVTVTSCSAAQNCLNWTGNPGVLNNCVTNPSTCNAGSFCAQVLALQLNCDFGDYGCVPGLVGKCGDLVLCDSTSPCNGKKVRDILSICNSALGGGSCPQGCTIQYLSSLCGNLNQCFEGCQVSSWCSTHLCSVYIPSPAQTGTATVSDACSANPTLTYCDTVSKGNCSGSYVINREWIAVDACGNSNTCEQLITIIGKCQTSQICGSFNSQNPGGGYIWCNAHLACNPGKACTVYCQNASVTLSCRDGKSYTFPVPDCQVDFNPKCSTGSASFNGTSWTTTLPCAGDNQIFLSGCGIPWQSDFANCQSVCWTGSFTCTTPGVNCNWQWSAACYNSDLSNCSSINVKACQQTSCGYNNNDCAGTPENCKSSCRSGACGNGGNNYCGSWSSTGSFTCQ